MTDLSKLDRDKLEDLARRAIGACESAKNVFKPGFAEPETQSGYSQTNALARIEHVLREYAALTQPPDPAEVVANKFMKHHPAKTQCDDTCWTFLVELGHEAYSGKLLTEEMREAVWCLSEYVRGYFSQEFGKDSTEENARVRKLFGLDKKDTPT